MTYEDKGFQECSMIFLPLPPAVRSIAILHPFASDPERKEKKGHKFTFSLPTQIHCNASFMMIFLETLLSLFKHSACWIIWNRFSFLEQHIPKIMRMIFCISLVFTHITLNGYAIHLIAVMYCSIS